MRHTINAAELASRLREKRISQGLSVREAARAAGVSHATLSRVLGGRHIPDSANLLLLARWLGISSVEELARGRAAVDHAEEKDSLKISEADVYMPDSVANLLRADRTLKPAQVEFLIVAFRSMYDGLRASTEDPIGSELSTPALNTR